MKLLVLIICLILERSLVHKIALKRFSWYGSYFNKIESLLENYRLTNHPALLLVLVILPIIVLICVVELFFSHILMGIPAFALDIAVLYYCLGPELVFYPGAVSRQASETQNESAESYFSNVNSSLFAPLFFFLIGGAAGVVLYRLIYLSARHRESLLYAELLSIIEWIPARITALLYLLVGNFQKAVRVYVADFMSLPSANHQLLANVGMTSAMESNETEIGIGVAQTMVEHSVIMLLVIVAIITLVSLV